MVRLQLSIQAELENVTDLQPASEDFEYFFKVKCTSCNETHPKTVGINRFKKQTVSSSKGNTANFVWKCSFCKRESSAKFDPTPSQVYKAEYNGQFEAFLIIDCRGLEFVDFDPRGLWKCVGLESKTTFSEVDMENENEWTDYDEKAALPVGASNIQGKWSRA